MIFKRRWGHVFFQENIHPWMFECPALPCISEMARGLKFKLEIIKYRNLTGCSGQIYSWLFMLLHDSGNSSEYFFLKDDPTLKSCIIRASTTWTVYTVQHVLYIHPSTFYETNIAWLDQSEIIIPKSIFEGAFLLYSKKCIKRFFWKNNDLYFFFEELWHIKILLVRIMNHLNLFKF